MSDDGQTIDDAVDGYQQLAPRQVTIHEWRVLSWRNDNLTAYKVNLRNLTCGCPDHRMNNDDDEVCAHLASALFAAERNMDVGTALNFDLVERQREMEKIAGRLEQTASAVEAEASHLSETAENAAQSDASEDTTEDTGSTDDVTPDEVQAVYSWLEDQGLPASKVKVWKSDAGSVQIDTTEKLDNDEFAVLSDTDQIWYDGENNRNYIKEDNLREVLS